MQQLLIHRTDIHALEDLGPLGFRQQVVGVGGVQGVAHAVFHRLAKAQPINRAWAVLIELGGGGFPAGKAAFSKPLDDLAQPRQDRIALEVSGAAAFGQPRMQTNPSGGRGCAIRPAGNTKGGSQLSGGGCEAEAKGGTLRLTVGVG